METPPRNDRLELLALTWFWCQKGKPKKLADLGKAKGGIGALIPEGSPDSLIANALDHLVRAGLVERVVPKKKAGAATFSISAAGARRIGESLGRSDEPNKATFAALLKSDLAWLAVGMPASQAERPKGVILATTLQLALCANHFQLAVQLDHGVAYAKLALVKLALARSHGLPSEKIALKKLPTGELPALVAAPLLGLAGTAASKIEKLIETASLRILDITSVKEFDLAVVRRWIATGLRTCGEPRARTESLPTGTPTSVENLQSFSHKVIEAAREVARNGRDGVSNLGDKVLIEYCWRRYGQRFEPIPLDQFKTLLSRANGDYLILVCEDLIPDSRRQEFTESEVRVGASSYHYIRL